MKIGFFCSFKKEGFMQSKDRLCNRFPGSSRCRNKKEKGKCPVWEGHCVSGLNLKIVISDHIKFLTPSVKEVLIDN